MPDSFVEMNRRGWGSRIMGSFMGALVGIFLFFGSFVLLYWNEGRTDFSKVAKLAVPISAEAVDASADGKFVSVTGTVKTEETVGDGYFLNLGNWLAVDRRVEMYAWNETKSTKSQTNTGGSSTETTTYTYDKRWVSNPESSADFRHPEGHENPAMPNMEGSSGRVGKAKIGAYDLAMGEITLPDFKDLSLSTNLLELKDGFTLADSKYLFKGKGSSASPEVGDLRVSYSVVPNGFDGTVFGKLEGSTLRTYMTEKGDTLYRLFYGGRDAAIKTLATEFTVLTWILRGVGFLMMFIGLLMFFGPISVFLDVLPIFGHVSRAAIGGLSFLVSLVLSLVTILVSMLFHSLMAVAVVVGILVIGLVMWIRSKRKSKAPVAPMAN